MPELGGREEAQGGLEEAQGGLEALVAAAQGGQVALVVGAAPALADPEDQEDPKDPEDPEDQAERGVAAAVDFGPLPARSSGSLEKKISFQYTLSIIAIDTS